MTVRATPTTLASRPYTKAEADALVGGIVNFSNCPITLPNGTLHRVGTKGETL